MTKHTIGIDLGTANTLIWLSGQETAVFNEPTVLTRSIETGAVQDIGYLASKMLGRAPYNIKVVKPMRRGVIADVDAAVDFITQAFTNLKMSKFLKGSSIVLASPSDITPIEQNALIEVARRLGAKEAVVESEAKMAAIGAGVDIYSPRGNMIVDIGGGTTDIAVISLGEIVVTKSTSICGDTLDEAVIRYMRNKQHLIIGEKTAEYIKMKIGSVEQDPDNKLIDVNGRDIVSSLPHSVIVSTSEIRQILLPLLNQIAEVIVDTLEITPPELSADIVHNGLVLCGGGSLLSGSREFFEKRLNIPVHVASYPLDTVINGIIDTYGRKA